MGYLLELWMALAECMMDLFPGWCNKLKVVYRAVVELHMVTV